MGVVEGTRKRGWVVGSGDVGRGGRKVGGGREKDE